MAQALVLVMAGGALRGIPLSAAVVYQEPRGIQFSIPGAHVTSNQYVGVRFSLSQPTELTALRARFASTSGSFFAALVGLPSINSLPQGNPFNPGEVIYSTEFNRPTLSMADNGSENREGLGILPTPLNIPVSVTLGPGVYGLIFGGNTGTGDMVSYNTVPGSTSLLWTRLTFPMGWQDDLPITWDISIEGTVVPEPGTYVLFITGAIAILLKRTRRKRMTLSEQRTALTGARAPGRQPLW